MKAFLFVLSCSFLIVSGQVLWKIAIDNNDGLINSKYSVVQNVWNLLTSPYMLSGLFIYMFATVFWMYLLGKYDYSFIYPLFSITYVLSFIFAYFLFNETITLYKVIGVMFIILGVIITSKSN
jgi:drug/metabolite transporter (DMT)-like permease